MTTHIVSGTDTHTNRLARRLRRTASAVVALAATCTLVPVALADPATAVTHQSYIGGTVTGTYNGGTINPYAAAFPLTVTSEGATGETFAYCIELNVSGISGTYTENDWATSGIPNLGKVSWILNHSFPEKTLVQLNAVDLDGDGTSNDADEEVESQAAAASATQAAIWHFTNGFDLTGGVSPQAMKLYTYLVTNAVDQVQPIPALDVRPEAGVSGIAGSDVGPFTVEIVNGVATLTLDPAAAGFAIVDGAGNPVSTVGDGAGTDTKDVFVRTPIGAGSGSVKLTAESNEVTLLAGRVFKQQGKQTLILAQSEKVKKDDFEVASYTAASFDAKVVKTVTSDAQGTVGYSIVVSNNGNSAATFSVTDQIADGLQYIAADNAGNGWNAGDVQGPGSKSQSVTLAAGASKTLAIVLRHESADAAGNTRLCNVATAPTSIVVNGTTITEAQGTQGDNSSQACTTVPPRYDVDVTKVTQSGPVDYGDDVSFAVRATNNGNIPVSIAVSDTYNAAQYSFKSASPTASSQSAGQIVWNITLAPGASFNATVVLTVRDGITPQGTLCNTVSVPTTYGEGNPVDSDGTNTAQACASLNPRIDVGLVKSAAAGELLVGDQVDFTLTVTNTGNQSVSNIPVSDQIPAGYDFVADAVNSAWTYNAGTRNATTTVAGPLAPGQSAALALRLIVVAGATAGDTGNLCNVGIVSLPGDENGQNNTGRACTQLVGTYDLALRKTTSSTVVKVGDVVPFEIRVFNQGNVVASGITVTDHVPAGFAYNASLNPGWVDNGDGTVSQLIAGPLVQGGETTVTLNLVVDTDAAAGNLLNVAEITGDDGDDVDSTTDTNPTNDAVIDDEITKTPATGDEDDHDIASVTLEVPVVTPPTTTPPTVTPPAVTPPLAGQAPKRAKLAIAKTAGSAKVQSGAKVSYTIRVTNTSKISATGVQVCDLLPDGLGYVSSSRKATFKAGKLCWNVGTIKSAKSLTITVMAKVAAAKTGKLTNTATAAADNAAKVSAKAQIMANKPKQQVRGVVAVTG